MSLIFNLQEMLTDPLFVFEHMEPDPFSKTLAQFKELIKQAMDIYDPMQYENEKSLKLLEQAHALLKEEKKPLSYGYINMAFLIQAALEKNRGDWNKASLETTMGLVFLFTLTEQKPDAWSYFLMASTLRFNAQIEQILSDDEAALSNYKRSEYFYRQALQWLPEHMHSIEDPILRITLYDKILHSFQRMCKELADLYLSQSEYKKALEYYQFVSALGQIEPCQTFYQAMLTCFPDMKQYFEKTKETDMTDASQIQKHLAMARWQALLCLDQPDIEEVVELFKMHFSRIVEWQTDPEAVEKIDQPALDALFFLFEIFLASPLFKTIKDSARENELAEDPGLLYEQFKHHFLKIKAQSERENEQESLDFLKFGPREKEICYQYRHHLALAQNYREKDEKKEKKALEKALLYCAALVNQSHVTSDNRKYLIDLIKIYMMLGDYSERTGEFDKTADFYQKAEYYLRVWNLEEFDDGLKCLENIYEALIGLYTRLEVQYKVNQYTWQKEKCRIQLQQRNHLRAED